MLGRAIADPDGLEGTAEAVEGLGLLPVDTVLIPAKRLADVSGISLADGAAFVGYEIHAGRTAADPFAPPLLRFNGGSVDGTSAGRVAALRPRPFQPSGAARGLAGADRCHVRRHRTDGTRRCGARRAGGGAGRSRRRGRPSRPGAVREMTEAPGDRPLSDPMTDPGSVATCLGRVRWGARTADPPAPAAGERVVLTIIVH